MFDPGCCTGRLRGCPFLGKRHALRVGWARLDAVMIAEAGAFLVHGEVEHNFQERTSDSLRRTCCSPRRQSDTRSHQSPTARGYVNYGDEWVSGNAMEQGV